MSKTRASIMASRKRGYITPGQARMLKFVITHIAATCLPPTYREIIEALGMRGTNEASECLARLEREGYVIRDENGAGGLSRSIRVLRYPNGRPFNQRFRFPDVLVMASGSVWRKVWVLDE